MLGASCACEVPRTTTNISNVAQGTSASLAGMINTVIQPTRITQTDIGPSHSHTEYVALNDSRAQRLEFCTLRRPVRGARDSSVSIETRLRNGRSGVRILPGKTDLIFSNPSRTALGPTQPHMQWVLGISRGKRGRSTKLDAHLRLLPALRISGNIPLLPHTPSWRGQGPLDLLYFNVFLQFRCASRTPARRPAMVFLVVFFRPATQFPAL